MIEFFGWVKRHWYIPLILLVSSVAYLLLGKRKTSPLTQTKVELEAIRVAAETKKIETYLGTLEARKVIEDEYRETIKQLDQQKREQAQELRKDPAKLAKFLVRAGGISKQSRNPSSSK